MYWASYLGLGQGVERERRGLSQVELIAFQQGLGQFRMRPNPRAWG